jgi:hypothetical protein
MIPSLNISKIAKNVTTISSFDFKVFNTDLRDTFLPFLKKE